MSKSNRRTPDSVDQDTSLMSPKQRDEFLNQQHEDMLAMKRQQLIKISFMDSIATLDKYGNREKQSKSGRPKNPVTWPYFPHFNVPLPSDQFLSPDQMREICNTIRDKKFDLEKPDLDDDWVEINFETKELYWERFVSKHWLRGIVVKLKFTVDKHSYNLFVTSTDRLNATIIAGSDNGSKRAFLATQSVDGAEYIFELDSFSMLSVDTGTWESGHMGVFALFDKLADIFYTDYFMSRNKTSTLFKCAANAATPKRDAKEAVINA